MAQLPGDFLIQHIGDNIIVFQRYTEHEIVRWPVADNDATAKAQQVIHDSPELSDEAKCFAHFWAGYFYACHAHGAPEVPGWVGN